LGHSVGRHAGWDRIPREATGLPILTYVRNPWDWYVSWYHANMGRETPTPVFRRLSGGRTLDFATMVRRACALGDEAPAGDLCTAYFRLIVGDGLDSPLLTIGRFESLIDDLESFLVAAGVKSADGSIARMRAAAPLNASKHDPYHRYYSEELRDLVGESCQLAIDRFGYRF
jgi:hypothetical protein